MVKYAPKIAASAQRRKRKLVGTWRVDETYIKVRGTWTYLYWATNRHGKTLDFMLSERRDTAAARRFFKQAIATNGQAGLVNIDKSGSNLAGFQAVNVILKFQGNGQLISIRQKKYLNNILEQLSRGLEANHCQVTDHRFIKLITGPMLGFKVFHSAAATIAGIEAAYMIRKGQIDLNGLSPFQQFAELAAKFCPKIGVTQA